jgi:hypothetical protein
MIAHLSRIRLFQRHLRSLVWVWVWVWDWIHSHTPPRTLSPSSCHPPFTHYPFPLHSLVCGGQPSPHKPRLVISHSTCPPLSSCPHEHSFVLGTAVINTQTEPTTCDPECCLDLHCGNYPHPVPRATTKCPTSLCVRQTPVPRTMQRGQNTVKF